MDSDAIVALAFLILASVSSLSWSPLGRALIERLRRPAGRDDAALPDEVAEELRALRREVAELGERMDFAERLLAKQSAPGRVSP